MLPLTLRQAFASFLLVTTGFAADPAWLGAWQDEKDGAVALFEKDRCAFHDKGTDPVFGCAVYTPEGDVWARAGGSRVRLKLKVAGDRLDLQVVGGASGIYKRLATVPADLQVAPLEIPAEKAVTPARMKEIKAEASKRVKKDQEVRKNPGKRNQMGNVDADNTAWIKTIIAEVGWLDAKRFGKDTASTMFLFVQHSGDLPLMLGALPCIERDLKAKVCDPQDFALLYDRVQMMTGRPQRYGSQIVPDNGKQVVYQLDRSSGSISISHCQI